MTDVHILNGDALAEKFPWQDAMIICRECLIEGPVKPDKDERFWSSRASYLATTYGADPHEYSFFVNNEFEKIRKIGSDAAINLWFEHDLFCQVNLWFVIDFVRSHKIGNPLYFVPPTGSKDWEGFGRLLSGELVGCFAQRRMLTDSDIQLACGLWNAYATGNVAELNRLAVTPTSAFPHLQEVCNAHTDRFGLEGRPKKRLKQILAAGLTNFDEIFREFSRTEGIYGFGDTQVKALLRELDSKEN